MTTESQSPARWLGPVLIVALSFIWGINWPAIRVTVQEIDPWTFRAVCMVAGSAMLFGASLARRMTLVVPRADILPLIALGLLNVSAYQLLSAYGLTMVEAGRGAILAFTFPLWAVLLGTIFLKERLTKGRLFALALGLGGMALLMGPDLFAVGRSPLGGLLLTASAIVWAAATVLYKARRWTLTSHALAAWQVLIGSVPVVIGALSVGDPQSLQGMSPTGLAGLFYAAVIAVAFGQWIWFRVLQLLPSSVASISTLAVPVIGVFSGAILLGEPLGWRELAALTLVSAGLFLVLVGREGINTARAMLRRRGNQTLVMDRGSDVPTARKDRN